MPTKKKTTAKKSTAKKSVPDLRRQLAEAAMQVAATQGWPAVTPAAIAKAAKVKVDVVQAVFAQPVDVLLYLVQLADDANDAFVGEGSVRDQLFELTMQRFDILAPYREGIAAVESARTAWPKLACALLPALLRSSSLMLEKAGVPVAGPISRIRQVAWLAVKADVARHWFEDDGADLSVTMAALDHRLAQLEKVAEVSAPWRV